MLIITKAMPINNINSKCHYGIKKLKAIGLGGLEADTYSHTNIPGQKQFQETRHVQAEASTCLASLKNILQ